MVSKLKPYNVDTKEDREEFILSYIPYVNSIASTVSRQYSSKDIVEDLRSCGYQGLLEAVNKFDPSKNVTFKYYAYIRIYGHMLDCMRKQYAGSNATVAMKKKINKLIEKSASNGDTTDSEKVASELGLSLKEYQKLQRKINDTTFSLNFTDLGGSNGEGAFDIQTQSFLTDSAMVSDNTILVEQLWKIMDKFPEREKQIMELIYIKELTYPEIAKQFDITDRRISQIHLDVLSRLRKLVKYGRHTKLPEHRTRKCCVEKETQNVNQ